MIGCEHNPNRMSAPSRRTPMLHVVESPNGDLVIYARTHLAAASAERVMGKMLPFPGGEVELLLPDRGIDNAELVYVAAGRHATAGAALQAMRVAFRLLWALCPHGTSEGA